MLELMLGGALALFVYLVARPDWREWKREREREREEIKRIYLENSTNQLQADQSSS
jgi:hypothetical protein